MPQWKDVSQPHDARSRSRRPASAPPSRRAVRSSRSPPRRATCATSRTRARRPSAIRRGRPTARFVSYFSDKSGEYKLVHRSAGRHHAAARDRAPGAEPLLHAAVVAGRQAHRVSRHPPSRSGCSTSRRAGEGRRHRSVHDAGALARIRAVSPRRHSGSRTRKRLPSMFRAIFVYNVETGETKQITDGLADATSPAWDASGKYLWFLASHELRAQLAAGSTCRRTIIRRRGALPRGAAEERSVARCCPRATRRARRTRRRCRRAPARDSARQLALGTRERHGGIARDRRAARRVGAHRLRWIAAAHHRRARRRAAQLHAARAPARRARCSSSSRFRRPAPRTVGGGRRRPAGRCIAISSRTARRRRSRRTSCSTSSAPTARSCSIAQPGAAGRSVSRRRRQGGARRPDRGTLNDAAPRATSIRRPSSSRCSTRGGATSATTSTCRTCTAPTGRG